MPNAARQASPNSIEGSAALAPRAMDGGFGGASPIIYERAPQAPSGTTNVSTLTPTDGSQTTSTVPTVAAVESTTTSSLDSTTITPSNPTISQLATTSQNLTTSTTLFSTSRTLPSSSFSASTEAISSSSSLPIRSSSITLVTASIAATHVTDMTDNGQSTTATSTPPSTSISGAAHNRTAIIAGSTCAAVALVIIIFAAIFLRRRHKIGQIEALTSTKSLDREEPREGRGLLAGEGLDDYNSRSLPTHSYRDRTEWGARTSSSSSPLYPSSLSFHRARSSEVGSIFREDVWPPPADFVDPFARSVRHNQEVHLGNIVDGVMGSERTEHKYSRMHSPSPSSLSGDHTGGAGSQNTDSGSDIHVGYTNLLDGYFEQRQKKGSPTSSMHSRDSSGSSDTIRDFADNQTVTGHEPLTLPARTLQNSSVRGVGTSRPKHPSPLAKAVPSASRKADDRSRMLLERMRESMVVSRSDNVVGGARGSAL